MLTFSCYRGYRFLEADRTCQWFANAIEQARQDLEFSVWAYVFMPEHAHLSIHPQLPSYDISQIRKAIKAPVAKLAISFLEETSPDWIERITRNRGEKTERLFWQSGGGHDRNIESATALLAEIDYIHLNPVKRELVESATDWKWSSAGWFAGLPANSLRPDPIPPEWVT